MSALEENKPCLVQTERGLSVLYKERYLYSRYNPSAAAERLADSAEFREDTLILCFSPILGYGLAKLAAKLKSGCRICVIEADKNLFSLYRTQDFPPQTLVVKPDDISRFPLMLYKHNAADSLGNPVPPPGTFRRSIRLDFSAAPALQEQTYSLIQHNADRVIASFWQNRLTLIKMGRLYHRNLFRNLGLLPASEPFVPGSVHKPILVCGAGPSADKVLDSISRLPPHERQLIYIIAVDAALAPMLKRHITPDAVAAVECQFAIQKAYYGAARSAVPLFADLTSRAALLRPRPGSRRNTASSTGGTFSFFMSEFAETGFMEKLKKTAPFLQFLPPLGSVGLAAAEIALRLRYSAEVPVFTAGLDFSFIPGKTHCRGSPHMETMLEKQNRLYPPGNPSAAYREGAYTAQGVSGPVSTDRALSGYCALFRDRYKHVPNLYDLECTGLPLGLPVQTVHGMMVYAGMQTQDVQTVSRRHSTADEIKQAVLSLYDTEEQTLTELKSYLTGGGAAPEQISALLKDREYLYLHFPDGYRVSADITFLKRVRAEIDFFLKDIKQGRSCLQADE